MSLNHVMFGDVGAWLWEFAGGIRPQAGKDNAGFRCFTVVPPATAKLTFFKGQYNSPHGVINWAWEKTSDGSFKGALTVPENCSVKFIAPDGKTSSLAAGSHNLQW